MAETPEPFDAGDEVAVKKRKTKVKIDTNINHDELRAVLATREGRAVIWRVIEGCYPFHSSYTGGETPLGMAYREGRRQVGVNLFDEVLQADAKAYMLMQNEAKQKDNA